MNNLEVEWRPLAQVIPYLKNSKTHPPEQIAKLVKIIAEFGWDVPIVVDEDGMILKGHGRRLAALEMQLPTVPVIVREGLSEAQKLAIRISDNKVAESDWDMELLISDFKELAGWAFDLSLTGFDEADWSSFTLDGGTEFQDSEVVGDRISNAKEGDSLPEPGDAEQENVNAQFAIIIQNLSEDQQLELLEHLAAEGYQCRALVS